MSLLVFVFVFTVLVSLFMCFVFVVWVLAVGQLRGVVGNIEIFGNFDGIAGTCVGNC